MATASSTEVQPNFITMGLPHAGTVEPYRVCRLQLTQRAPAAQHSAARRLQLRESSRGRGRWTSREEAAWPLSSDRGAVPRPRILSRWQGAVLRDGELDRRRGSRGKVAACRGGISRQASSSSRLGFPRPLDADALGVAVFDGDAVAMSRGLLAARGRTNLPSRSPRRRSVSAYSFFLVLDEGHDITEDVDGGYAGVSCTADSLHGAYKIESIPDARPAASGREQGLLPTSSDW